MTDYPQITCRLPARTKRQLLALSMVRQQPQWRLLVDAVDCYLRELPSAERAQIAKLLMR